MSRPILVTGTAGEAGRYTTQLLLEQRFEVRALVHRTDDRSDKLRANGAEVVVGDLFDFDSVRGALKDLNAGGATGACRRDPNVREAAGR